MSFGFGTASNAPTSLSGGFSFAANKPATPAFGLNTGTTQPSLFGAPTTSTPSFGAPTQTGSAFGGATSTPAFGASGTPAFGVASSVAPSFGAPTAATPSFGAPTAATPSFGVGTAATPSFGATTSSAFGATTSTTPAFGSLISSAPAFGTPSFGTTTSAFGTATTSAATGLSFGGTTSAPTLGGLGFTAPTSTTTATGGLGGLGGFNFLSAPASTAAATTQNFSFSGGLLGSAPTTTTGVKLGPTLCEPQPSSTAAAPSVGLGGLEAPGLANAAKTGANASSSAGATDQQPRNTKLPNEVSQTVESFKNFVKKQKSLSSDVMRASVKPLHKVHSTCESLRREASALSASIRGTRTQSRRLRAAGVRALAAAEGAQRTHDTPPGLQYDNETPPAYVVELISELESQLLTFRKQIEVADKQMQATPKALTEQDLTLGMKRIHDSFVALAGRLQSVHAQVEAHKGQYLSLRRHLLKDTTDVFEDRGGSGGTDLSNLDRILKDAEDTRNLTTLIGIGDVSNTSAVLADPRAALSARHRLTGPTPFQYLGTSGFGGIPLNPMPAKQTSTGLGSSWSQSPQTNLGLSLNTSAFAPAPALQLGSSGFQESTPGAFQLQKPPKRGKH